MSEIRGAGSVIALFVLAAVFVTSVGSSGFSPGHTLASMMRLH